MVLRKSAPSSTIVVAAPLAVVVAPLAAVVAPVVVRSLAPPGIAPSIAVVRLSVPAVVADVLPLANPPDLTLVGLSQPCLRPSLALTMAPHRFD